MRQFPVLSVTKSRKNGVSGRLELTVKIVIRIFTRLLYQPKYYPEANCKICHNEDRWADVTFDHSKTDFKLTGAHAGQDCRACHFKKDTDGIVKQKFSGSFNRIVQHAIR